MTLVGRHIPCTDFRKYVRKLDSDTRVLFDDTLVKFLIYASSFDLNLIMSIVLQTTTVPHLDDMGFDPQNPTLAVVRPSTSTSPDAPSTPSTSCSDLGGALPYLSSILVELTIS
jgi:hypothetical protein